MVSAARDVRKAPVSDEQLIERTRAGDERAFAALYKRHARYIAGVVYRLLGNDEHLDDIVQDTFVAAMQQLHELREARALRRWLTTIAVRRAKRCLASRYRRRALHDALEEVTPRVDEPSAKERVDALYRALERVPEKYRVPWVLHHIEGETLPVVAELCGSSLTSVKRYIAETNKRLRRSYHER